MSRPLPFVLVASDHGPMILNRLDFHAVPGGAYGVGHQILTNGAYDPKEIVHVQDILGQLVDSRGLGVVALDCGANIGVHTVEMAKKLSGGLGRVIAVEAQERIFYALCGNIALSNLFNASAIFGAVGGEDGLISIPKPDYLRPASFGSLELKRQEGTEYIGQSISYASKDLTPVPIFRIDSLRLSRLDFLKIDIEGMEMEALRGAENMIAQFHPTVLVEWIKSDRKELEEFLHMAEYDVKEFGANLLATH